MKQEIRFILTQVCNYNCSFCHHEGIKKSKENKLDKDDIVFLYKTYYKNFHSDTITITGGEPFLKKDFNIIVGKLYESGCNITVVTNGSLLDKKLEVCKYLKKLNISLHSLQKEVYDNITGTENNYKKVINNIKLVREAYPLLEININYVVTYSPKEEMYRKIGDILEFAKKYSVNIKFIEVFPQSNESFFKLEELEKILLENKCYFIKKEDRKKLFLYENNKVYTTKCLCANAIEYGKPGKFCNKNNDLFIAQDGTIKPCRIQNYEIYIYDAVKDRNEKVLTSLLQKALNILGNNCPYIEKARKKAK